MPGEWTLERIDELERLHNDMVPGTVDNINSVLICKTLNELPGLLALARQGIELQTLYDKIYRLTMPGEFDSTDAMVSLARRGLAAEGLAEGARHARSKGYIHAGSCEIATASACECGMKQIKLGLEAYDAARGGGG